jgi:hypothetical protein
MRGILKECVRLQKSSEAREKERWREEEKWKIEWMRVEKYEPSNTCFD